MGCQQEKRIFAESEVAMRRVSRKKFLLLLVVGTILFGMFYQRYWTRSETADVIALWNDKELFTFVNVHRYGFSCGYLTQLLIMAGIPVLTPRLLREDTLVYHYQSGQLGRFEIKDFTTTGGFIPFEGQLYKLIGGNTYPLPIWRWTGSTFERLPDKEAGELRARMNSQFRYASDQLKAEGWQENKYAGTFQEQEKSYQFNVSGNQVNLLVKKAGEGTELTLDVFLHATNLPVAGEVLAKMDPKWKKVGKAEYLALAGASTGKK